MRYTLGLVALGGATVLSGCHIDMWQQPKMKAYYESDFYLDRQSSRAFPEGTIAQGQLRTGDAYTTGKEGTKFVAKIPAEAVSALGGAKAALDRGEDRYTVYCSPCHGALGNGNGFIAQRGLGFWQKLPASLHQPRLLKVEDGYIYDVLAHGKGAMYGYASRIQDYNDRWAVVAYVRLLQEAGTGHAPQTEIAPVASNPTSTAPTPKSASLATPSKLTAEEVKKEQVDLDAVMSGLSGDVLFDTAKADLKPSAQEFLTKVANVLKKHTGVMVEIGGHTDSQGDAVKNKTLSESRANAVKAFLASHGVVDSTLTAVGFGSEKPVADNATAEGRAKNRRITVLVQGGAK